MKQDLDLGLKNLAMEEKTTSMVIPINQVESQRMAIPNAFKRLRNTFICGMCVWYA